MLNTILIGYTNDRCSECIRLSVNLDSVTCDGSHERDPLNGGLGFYRLDGRCEPCPCTWIRLEHMVTIGAVLLLMLLGCVDIMTSQIDHISTILAPGMIMVTFCQTLALLLDLDIPWPPEFRALLKMLNIFNINIELARPECTVPFTFATKLEITLMFPPFVFVVIAAFVAGKFIIAKYQGEQKFRVRHNGSSSGAYLIQQALMMASSFFIVCSIFFLRTVLRGLHCAPLSANLEQYFLVVEPEVFCDNSDDRYVYIQKLSYIGILGFSVMFGMFCIGVKFKPDLFEFLVRCSALLTDRLLWCLLYSRRRF